MENKMEQIASLFNRELNERFKVRFIKKDEDDNVIASSEVEAYFSEDGFNVANIYVDYFYVDTNLFLKLLVGDGEIIEDNNEEEE